MSTGGRSDAAAAAAARRAACCGGAGVGTASYRRLKQSAADLPATRAATRAQKPGCAGSSSTRYAAWRRVRGAGSQTTTMARHLARSSPSCVCRSAHPRSRPCNPSNHRPPRSSYSATNCVPAAPRPAQMSSRPRQLARALRPERRLCPQTARQTRNPGHQPRARPPVCRAARPEPCPRAPLTRGAACRPH